MPSRFESFLVYLAFMGIASVFLLVVWVVGTFIGGWAALALTLLAVLLVPKE